MNTGNFKLLSVVLTLIFSLSSQANINEELLCENSSESEACLILPEDELEIEEAFVEVKTEDSLSGMLLSTDLTGAVELQQVAELTPEQNTVFAQTTSLNKEFKNDFSK